MEYHKFGITLCKREYRNRGQNSLHMLFIFPLFAQETSFNNQC